MKTIYSIFVLLLLSINMNAQSGYNYKAAWKKIDELRSEQMPESAIVEVNKLYAAALKDKRYDDIVNALEYRASLQTELQDVYEAAKELQTDVEKRPFPVNAIASMILAETYSSVYPRNQDAEADDTDDIKLWGPNKLNAEKNKAIKSSLSRADELAKIPSSLYLSDFRDDEVNPKPVFTLYDCLASRALNTSRYQYSVMANEQSFADVNNFIKADIDSANITGQIYKQWLDLRVRKGESSQLAEVDMARLEYAKSSCRRDNCDALYETALKNIYNRSEKEVFAGNILYKIAQLYYEQGNNKKLHPQKSSDAHSLVETIINKYPLCGAVKSGDAKLFLNNIEYPQLSVNANKYIIPGEDMLVLLNYKNIKTVKIKIYKSSLDQHVAQENEITETEQANKIREIDYELPSKPDYNLRSTEIIVGALAPGFYKLAFTYNNPNISDNTHVLKLQSTNLAMVVNNKKLTVVNRKTGNPLENVHVKTYTNEGEDENILKKIVNSGVTDRYGDIDLQDNYSYKATATLGKDTIYDDGFYYYNSRSIKSNQPDEKIILLTDRAVYRPGQTIYLKGLVYENKKDDKKVIHGRTVEVIFRDANWKEITKQSFKSDEYGCFNGSFTIPHGLLNGSMSLNSPLGSVSVMVQEYKRPTFEIKILPPLNETKLNSKVTVKGTAMALAGYPVDNATVRYSVVCSKEFWRMWPNNYGSKEIASGDAEINKNGEFTFDFDAKPNEVDQNGIYNFTVHTHVTDANGETQSQNYTFRASNNPLIVSFKIPDTITSNTKLPITVTDLNNNNIDCNIEVSVDKIARNKTIKYNRTWEMPDSVSISAKDFESKFPYLNYDEKTVAIDEIPVEKNITKLTFNTSKTKEIDLSVLKNAQPGSYKITVKGTSNNGATTQSVQHLLYDENKTLPIQKIDEWLSAIKTEVEFGQKALFMLAGEKGSKIVLKLYNADKILTETKVINATPVPQKLEINVPKDGGFAHFVYVSNNYFFSKTEYLKIVKADKQIDITFETFRDKLQPGQAEKWKLTIKDKSGKPLSADLAATMYDASLDAFMNHSWANMFDRIYSSYDYMPSPYSPSFGTVYEGGVGGYVVFNDGYAMKNVSRSMRAESDMVMATGMSGSLDMAPSETKQDFAPEALDEQDQSLPAISPRTNFNETAFFYPCLRTNEKGEIVIEFTVPESLTRWKMMGFANTPDMKVANIERELVTVKEVAIYANAPRFFREGDTITLTAKINNITGNKLPCTANLQLFNALTGQKLQLMAKGDVFEIGAENEKALPVTPLDGDGRGQTVDLSTVVSWKLCIPKGLQALTYRVTAKAGNHTDGEEKTIPVLNNTVTLTESIPFTLRRGQTSKFTFDRFKNSNSATLQNRSLTLEFTSNPAWYAVQALPYLIEYPYDCSEQIFSRLYANSIASSIVSSSPRIKQMFDLWGSQPSDALLSNLQKNEELKQTLIEETPWLSDAISETESKKRIALLFDLNKSSSDVFRDIEKLKKAQYSSGAFAWFEGMTDNRYITQHIVTGLARLNKIGALPTKHTGDVSQIVSNGFKYLDNKINADHKQLLDEAKKSKNKDYMSMQHISSIQVHYLYAASSASHVSQDAKTAVEYYIGQAYKYRTSFGMYEQAMIALVAYRNGNADEASKIIKSLTERAKKSENIGMYWDSKNNYNWNSAPVETQAMMIEAYSEINKDQNIVDELKLWLLCQKQTSNWNTTKATADAVYALLMQNKEIDKTLLNTAEPEIKVGGKAMPQKAAEAGTGYIKTVWSGNDIKKSLADVEIKNNANSIAWGAMYWQYSEDADNVTSAAVEQLEMKRQLYVKTSTGSGQVLTPLSATDTPKPGDIITVRIILKTDRDMEYVHIKDTRASGTEPVNTLSGYRYKNGMGYYENVKDASTNIFIDRIGKGSHIFEYDLYVSHRGGFSMGVGTVQCMYAPEFGAHSSGIRLNIK